MNKTLEIKVGEHHTIRSLITDLEDFGYCYDDNHVSGTYRSLGDTIKIYPVNSLSPFAIEFFGDEIEKINVLSKENGRKVSEIETVNIERNCLYLSDGLVSRDDYIVHEDHGIGIFSHKETLLIDNEPITYSVFRYYGEDILRVPPTQSDKISRYFGIGRRRPKLNKLGSGSWKRTYQKTYENIITLARELLFLYAGRQISKKLPLAINSDWNEKISDSFGFKETPDQNTAIREVFNDLQRDTPMDRLICGDVGFGKTEVAIRTIAQAAANGRQAAILVPTTILAEQHFVTFKKRFQALPVRIERLSRFVEKAEQDRIISEIESGKADIIVATHKILRSHIKFKNLGLLVIDEEQKFGVKDKEKLKKYREEIDVLTLTATPIPRTLFMALSGLRDISTINSIPAGRKAIDTSVTKYDESLIREAIRREIQRNGQIYYLHNQVSSISGIKRKLAGWFPNLRIEVAHGQMSENALSSIMREFADGIIDILVCSTIIENGLDLPNVNTLIVDEADKFGLSQLYQIRGRIGRSIKQSYALFTFRGNLTYNATKRLKALAENVELGTGYNIALHDLEIRGGGNILGKDQHGNMEAVGLVLYGKMLNMAVKHLR